MSKPQDPLELLRVVLNDQLSLIKEEQVPEHIARLATNLGQTLLELSRKVPAEQRLAAASSDDQRPLP